MHLQSEHHGSISLDLCLQLPCRWLLLPFLPPQLLSLGFISICPHFASSCGSGVKAEMQTGGEGVCVCVCPPLCVCVCVFVFCQAKRGRKGKGKGREIAKRMAGGGGGGGGGGFLSVSQEECRARNDMPTK